MGKRVLMVIGHLAFWLASFYIITGIFGISTVEIFEEQNNGVEEKVLVRYDHKFSFATAITIGLCILIFYTNTLVLLRDYFVNRKIDRYLTRIGLLIAFAIGLNILLNRYLNYGITGRTEIFLFPSFGLHMALFVFYTAISVAYAFTLEWYKSEKIKNQIIEEKLKTELDFLKSQINPHFLFNTLNNLFSISQKHQVDELSAGIQELSNLMRYMLYESNADFVSLKKEIQYIESYIEIQQLRHNEEDELIVNFEKQGDPGNYVIAPMLLLPFVENAFKHGFSINERSIINIYLKASDAEIRFKVTNKAFKQHKFADKSSGIGLENVTRRLHLIYPNKHHLNIAEANGSYSVELILQIHG